MNLHGVSAEMSPVGSVWAAIVGNPTTVTSFYSSSGCIPPLRKSCASRPSSSSEAGPCQNAYASELSDREYVI